MNLEDIWNLGPAKKEISITNGYGEKKSVTIYLRPLSFGLVMRSAPESDKEESMDIMAERIAYSVCNEVGDPLFTKDQVKGTAKKSLGADIVLALMTAVNEFNNFSEDKHNSEGK